MASRPCRTMPTRRRPGASARRRRRGRTMYETEHPTAGAPMRLVGERLAWYGWYVLLTALALGLLGGVLSYMQGPTGVPAAGASVETDPCPRPPCFGFGDLPTLPPSAIPGVLQLMAY